MLKRSAFIILIVNSHSFFPRQAVPLISMIPATDQDYTISPFVPAVRTRSIAFFETSCHALSTFGFSIRHVNVQNIVSATMRSSLRIPMESSWRLLLPLTTFIRRLDIMEWHTIRVRGESANVMKIDIRASRIRCEI